MVKRNKLLKVVIPIEVGGKERYIEEKKLIEAKSRQYKGTLTRLVVEFLMPVKYFDVLTWI